MYARLITVTVPPGAPAEFPSTFGELILPAFCQAHGFKGLYVMKSVAQDRLVALALWETEADALAVQAGEPVAGLAQGTAGLLSPPSAETLEVVLRA